MRWHGRIADGHGTPLAAGEIRLVSVGASGAQADGASTQPSLSGDGRYVAFASAASNLVTGIPLAFDAWTRWGLEQRSALSATIDPRGTAQTPYLQVAGPLEELSAVGMTRGGPRGAFETLTAAVPLLR